MDGSQASLALDQQDPEALARWQLSLVPGVGPRIFQSLLEQFGTAQAALDASPATRKQFVRGLRADGPRKASLPLTPKISLPAK